MEELAAEEPRGVGAVFAADMRELYKYRFVVHNVVFSQLKARYHYSVLGFFWTMLNPLLLLSVQTLAFSRIMKMGMRDYAFYLFSGLLLWQFFYSAMESASRSLLSNDGLIRKVAVPKIVFPIGDVMVAAVNMGFAFLSLLFLLLACGVGLVPQIVILPAAVALLVLFTFGLSLITMTLTTYFRDFQHIIGVLLSALYFASPILYPARMVIDAYPFLAWSPIYHYLELFRCALVPASILKNDPALTGGVWPDGVTWAWSVGAAVVMMAAGYIVYKRHEDEYIFRL